MANFGETLRQARAHKGVTLKEAEQATRIVRSYLAALEDENFRSLPPLTYQRGIVRNYALYLDLDPSRVLVLFDDARGAESETVRNGVEPIPPLNMPSHWAPNFAIISFSIVLSAIVFAWVYSALVQPPAETGEATQMVATVTPIASDVPLPTTAPATASPTPEPTPAPATTGVSQETERVDTGRETPIPEPTVVPTAEPTVVPTPDPGGSDNQLAGAPDSGEASEADIEALLEAAQQSDDVEQAQPEPAVEEAAEPAPATDGVVASIQITALDTIDVAVMADGVEVFNGTLQPGEQTPFFEGSSFNVYTSSGVNTQFLNGCGVEFLMGYEPGEATYPMVGQPCS